MRTIIKIESGITRKPEWKMAEPVDFELCDGEHIAITGGNGSGKSMLAEIITGRHPLIGDNPKYDFFPSTRPLVSDNIKYITFKDSYGESDSSYYLQQRWNQHDIDENTPTAGQLLEGAYILSGEDTPERRNMQKHLYELFDVRHLLDKYIILLSSGELRKFQLIRTLLYNPRVLIMDNPFIGLDTDTRTQLTELLTALSRERSLQIIIITSKADDIPPFITHVVEVCNMKVRKKITAQEYLGLKHNTSDIVLSKKKENAILNLPYKGNVCDCEETVKMTDVSICYGNRTILSNLNWTVHRGDRWALSGQNGAGKSTLLSLICADNPQGYACDISLFGNRRGTGESIWEIKRRIGYVSPEMHRAYHHNISSIRVVASGLKDSVGLYVKPDVYDYKVCSWWMNIFGIEKFAERPFLSLSSGEQRLVLLCRAFVKDPELLILDEPFHGLDHNNRMLATAIIETFCRRKGKTMIMVSHYAEELPVCIDHTLTLKRNI